MSEYIEFKNFFRGAGGFVFGKFAFSGLKTSLTSLGSTWMSFSNSSYFQSILRECFAKSDFKRLISIFSGVGTNDSHQLSTLSIAVVSGISLKLNTIDSIFLPASFFFHLLYWDRE